MYLFIITYTKIWLNRTCLESHPEIFQKPPIGHPRWRVYANPPIHSFCLGPKKEYGDVQTTPRITGCTVAFVSLCVCIQN